jgi:hypothetical protein
MPRATNATTVAKEGDLIGVLFGKFFSERHLSFLLKKIKEA